MTRIVASLAAMIFTIAFSLSAAAGADVPNMPKEADAMDTIPIKALILPKFELGELTGDLPGEAQFYYNHYLQGADAYEIPGMNSPLYVKDGVALCLLGMGKVSAALGTQAILSDKRFDFSQSYLLSVGCAGSARDASVMGDVFVITAAVDYDLGHHADGRELSDPDAPAWFHDADFGGAAVALLNPGLMERVFRLVRDVPVHTTDRTRAFMRAAFDGADWAVRDPMVLRGTTVSSDNYWKGAHGHASALLMVQTYGCPDPFATAEMEDIAVCHAARRMGLLDRLIILRASVNMDVFMLGETPESLWGHDANALSLANPDSVEAADIFETAMENNFAVGRVIIDAILDGTL